MTRRIVTLWLLIGVMSVSVIGITVLRFQNPHLTETELFLEFWYMWVIIVAAMGVTLKMVIK